MRRIAKPYNILNNNFVENLLRSNLKLNSVGQENEMINFGYLSTPQFPA
ncbi:hypothetical protein GCM10009094_40610 [Massilia aurea]